MQGGTPVLNRGAEAGADSGGSADLLAGRIDSLNAGDSLGQGDRAIAPPRRPSR